MDEELKQVLNKELELLNKEISALERKIGKSKFKESCYESEENMHKDQLSVEYFEKFKFRKAKERIKKEFKNQFTNFLMISPMTTTLVALVTFMTISHVDVLYIVGAIVATGAFYTNRFNRKTEEDKKFVKNFNVDFNNEMIDYFEEKEHESLKMKNFQVNNTTNLELQRAENIRRVQEIESILNPVTKQEEKELNKQKTK